MLVVSKDVWKLVESGWFVEHFFPVFRSEHSEFTEFVDRLGEFSHDVVEVVRLGELSNRLEGFAASVFHL